MYFFIRAVWRLGGCSIGSDGTFGQLRSSICLSLDFAFVGCACLCCCLLDALPFRLSVSLYDSFMRVVVLVSVCVFASLHAIHFLVAYKFFLLLFFALYLHLLYIRIVYLDLSLASSGFCSVQLCCSLNPILSALAYM